MENLWRDEDAKAFEHSDLAMRVYTSRLLGLNDDLVLHGGGNTSVKSTATNIFGEAEDAITGIAVGKIDLSVGSHGNGRRSPLGDLYSTRIRTGNAQP